MKILSVVGARPNFMKIAPFIDALKQVRNEGQFVEHILVHTGQHYDDRMSRIFFENLNIPQADINLEVGSGTHAEQVGNTMIAFEKVLLNEMPDWVVVVGDVNATLACSVTAKKLNIKVCHIEAGLRSGDMKMPEEINRLVTDRLSDLLLVPDRLSMTNLLNEGVKKENISFVGNIMIDTLRNNFEKASELSLGDIIKDNLINERRLQINGLDKIALITIHRPSNVDDIETISPIIKFFAEEASQHYSLVWPIHPRTKNKLKEFGLLDLILNNENIFMLHPLGYHEMIKVNSMSSLVFTDSGGIQEECCILGTPCLTMRWNTERPITLMEHGGPSVLVGNDVELLRREMLRAMSSVKKPQIPEFWDGQAAGRCVEAIINFSM